MRVLVRPLAVSNPLPKIKERLLSSDLDNLAFQYGCEPGQIYLAAKGVYACAREGKIKPPKLRSDVCRISEKKSSAPYPGMSATIKCIKPDQGGYALYNTKECRINFFGVHPTGQFIGTNSLPLIEDELENSGCKKISLTPIGRSENFFKKQGYKCSNTFGGQCLEMEKKL